MPPRSSSDLTCGFNATYVEVNDWLWASVLVQRDNHLDTRQLASFEVLAAVFSPSVALDFSVAADGHVELTKAGDVATARQGGIC